jgi:hypothetical protein
MAASGQQRLPCVILIDAARQMGLEPHRLIFADKVPLREHVQRLQLADLALDTDGYNGGATTANALWAGLPMLDRFRLPLGQPNERQPPVCCRISGAGVQQSGRVCPKSALFGQ